jgi:hypothetical protein
MRRLFRQNIGAIIPSAHSCTNELRTVIHLKNEIIKLNNNHKKKKNPANNELRREAECTIIVHIIGVAEEIRCEVGIDIIPVIVGSCVVNKCTVFYPDV